jgi:hypothetical protein
MCTKFDFMWIICRKSELSANYITEGHAFLGNNSRKVKTFCGLFCAKAGFSTVKYAESFSFRGLSDNS